MPPPNAGYALPAVVVTATRTEEDPFFLPYIRDTQRIPVDGTPGYGVYHLRLGWKPCPKATLAAALEISRTRITGFMDPARTSRGVTSF